MSLTICLTLPIPIIGLSDFKVSDFYSSSPRRLTSWSPARFQILNDEKLIRISILDTPQNLELEPIQRILKIVFKTIK